jgi:hypothetical protein
MDNLKIEQTKTTPKVDFRLDGELILEGVSLPEDSIAFYTPLFKWIEKLETKKVKLCMKLEYLNTSSTKQIFMLLKKFSELEQFENVTINWYYEEDDEDIQEAGEYYSSLLKDLNFRFIAYAEAI